LKTEKNGFGAVGNDACQTHQCPLCAPAVIGIASRQSSVSCCSAWSRFRGKMDPLIEIDDKIFCMWSQSKKKKKEEEENIDEYVCVNYVLITIFRTPYQHLWTHLTWTRVFT
jgi:hypothetical protein